MDNNIIDAGLQNQQALVSEPKNKELGAKRYKSFGAGCFIYALVYTLCLYHNTSGITYPFFAVATVYFFGFYLRRSETKFNMENGGVTSDSIKPHINERFIMASMLITGFINFTTDSWVLVRLNRLMMFVLLSVMVIQYWYDISQWSLIFHIRTVLCIALGALGRVLSPLGDMIALREVKRTSTTKSENDENRGKLVSVCIGLVASIPIAIIICAMLSSADAIFGNFIGRLFTFKINMDNIKDKIGAVCELLIVFGLCYGLITYNTDRENRDRISKGLSRRKTKWDAYIGVTMNSVICFFYLVFSIIQVFGLFLGKMKLPDGYTYASYAHQGFYQLVFVCLFNICLVLYCLSHFDNTRLLQILLTVICGCTYIMTASSAYRMVLYVASYGLTFLRIFVLWALLAIAIVMAGVTACIYNKKFALFRYTFIIVTIMWIVFSALRPDYFIASYNLRCQNEPDMYYIRVELSLDALPAVIRYAPDELKERYCSDLYIKTDEYSKEINEFLGIRKFNLSRAYATRIASLSEK